MRILDRHILKATASIFINTELVFIMLYVVIDALSHLDDILKQQMPPSMVGAYYLSYLPVIFIQTSPFACLIAVLYTFGKLNRDNEIIAMRAAGLSFWQICRSAVFLGALVSALVFFTNEKLVPKAQETTETIKQQLESSREKGNNPTVINNLSLYGFRNRLFFIKTFRPENNTVEGVTILEQDESQNITSKIMAEKGVWKDNYWTFYKCNIFNFTPNGQTIGEAEYYEELPLYLTEAPKDFMEQRQRPEYMNLIQLNKYIQKISKSGAKTVIRNLTVDFLYKTASPFTSLVIVLVGIPFSLAIRKRGAALSSIGICLIIGFLYYVLNAVSIALGYSGLIFPFWAAWGTNICFLALAWYKFSTAL